MRVFQGLFFGILGLGLVAIALRSLRTGWLPFGANGLRGRLEVRRGERRAGYWLAFALYLAGGVCLLVAALGILAGVMAPMPLR